jgi:hypothetical protein
MGNELLVVQFRIVMNLQIYWTKSFTDRVNVL